MRFVDISTVTVRMHEQIVLSDGTCLSADVYFPEGDESLPVLLTLTPYDNNRASRPREDGGFVGEAPARRWQRLAASGYVVVAVDVRGRGDSEGSFQPFVNEPTDGAACVEWARRLPESNGRVGMFGAGYSAWCALAASTESGQVDALFVLSPFGGTPDRMPFATGVLRLDWLFWMHLVGGRTIQPAALPPWAEIWWHLPALELDEALGRADIWWKEWLSGAGAHLATLEATLRRANNSDTPTKLVTGWWDQNLAATCDWWSVLTKGPGDNRLELVVGPWGTRGVRRPTTETGGINWGPGAIVDPDELLLRWFDDQFSANPSTGISVRTFVTGLNEWETREAWPPPGDLTRLYLTSGGGANTRRGNGRLVESDQLSANVEDSFTYDPSNPVRWHPRSDSFDVHPTPPVPLDTTHITSRDDALVYRSAPVEHAMRIVGRPQLCIQAATDADDADWIAVLADVFPGDLRTVALSHGVVRGASSPVFRSGDFVQYELELDDVDHVLLPGHRLELTIVSSLFPLYARNLGTADYVTATEPRTAEHRVRHGVAHESFLTVQVVEP